MRQHQYGVCIVARPSRTICTGVTNDLERRMWAHKQTFVRGCTADSGVTRLVYCEEHRMIDDAIARETQIKGWRREEEAGADRDREPEVA